MEVDSTTNTDKSLTCIKKVHEGEKPEEWTYYFTKDNTYLHSLFGHENGNFLLKFVQSKYQLAFIILCEIPIRIISNFFNYSIGFLICKALLILLFQVYEVVYMLLRMLSVNRACFKLVVSTFEFWFKLYSMIQFMIGYWCIYYIILADATHYNYPTLELFNSILTSWLCIGLYAFIASFDAVQIRFTLKVVMGIVTSAMFTVWAVYSNIIVQGESTEILSFGSFGSITISTLMDSSTQVLAIFSWKQTILTIVKKRRCVLIKYSPYLAWMDHN